MSNQVEQIRAEIERLIKNPRLDKEYNPAYKAGLRDLRKFIDSLPAETVPADIQDASRNYADKRLLENKRELAESGHTRHFKMGYVCFAGYEIEGAFADGMLAERERLMREAVETTVHYNFENRLAVTVQLPEDSSHKFCEKVNVIIIKKEK